MLTLAENVLAAGAENRPPMLEKGRPFKFKEITIPVNAETGRAEEKRLPNDIYTLLNHNKKAYDIWYRVKELMDGTELTKQERESKIADEFDRFTSEKGETIQSYYIRELVDIMKSRVGYSGSGVGRRRAS
ncbi:hypothetical protein Tco_0507979 [Tanacetum coccineum]